MESAKTGNDVRKNLIKIPHHVFWDIYIYIFLKKKQKKKKKKQSTTNNTQNV